METSILTPTQKYAAAALFALALHQSQIHQTRLSSHLLPLKEEPVGEGVSIGNSASVSDDPDLWIHERSILLLPVSRFLGVDDQAWHGLKETAGVSSQVRHHVGAFLTLLSEESDGTSSERMDKELALTKAVDATVLSMETSPVSSANASRSCGFEIKCHNKHSNTKIESVSDVAAEPSETVRRTNPTMPREEKAPNESQSGTFEQAVEEGALLSDQRKVTVLYELLSACVADNVEDESKYSQLGRGYDARHRVALRLLATWLNVKWIKMEAMEIMMACSLMDSLKEESAHKHENRTSEGPWANWKRGGMVGAAALAGGTLMAITGGLTAPAIAEGLGALAPTLGSLAPAVGASGFSAAASATGSVSGSVAVAASFGAAGAGLTGSKMARRTGNIDEFEFKEIGENHNQGLAVGIFVSGLAFQDEDFTRPWEGHNDNLERYALRWESKNLIALSTAIQDWLTSKIVLKLMKEGAMLTILNTLLAAFTLPATLVTASGLIDSKWAIGVDRSDKAGKLLAEVLLQGLQGNRPVTLIGFSLGARVIYKCLQCLAESKGDHAGIVERVVILGAPVPIKDEKWDRARKMVAGRFVNAYSTNDWTLGFALRTSLLSQGLAGIQPVDTLGIENVNVTELIEGHSSYLSMTKQILQQLDLNNYYPIFRTIPTNTQEEKLSNLVSS